MEVRNIFLVLVYLYFLDGTICLSCLPCFLIVALFVPVRMQVGLYVGLSVGCFFTWGRPLSRCNLGLGFQ